LPQAPLWDATLAFDVLHRHQCEPRIENVVCFIGAQVMRLLPTVAS
jgi:hypothetical protein